MKCIWCDRETQTTDKNLETEEVVFADEEHIFPEGVGGKRTFKNGEICKECNNRISYMDGWLRYQNVMMMKHYQDASEILMNSGERTYPLGKKRSGKKGRKKIEEVTNITGYSGYTKLEREPRFTNHIKLINSPDGWSDYLYNDKFSKALHKCVVNVLLDFKGYDYVKKNYPDLIDFVNDKNNHSYHNWSYGICYGDIHTQIPFEPFYDSQYVETLVNNEVVIGVVVLIFPSAIFVLCPFPIIVDRFLLEKVGSNPPNLHNWEEAKFDYIKHFQMGFSSPRKTFGDQLKFTLVKKEIRPVPK